MKNIFISFTMILLAAFGIFGGVKAMEYYRGTPEEISQIKDFTAGYESIDGQDVNEGGVFKDNVLPLKDNSYDIGSAAKSWNDIYADGNLILGGNATIIGTLNATISGYISNATTTLDGINIGGSTRGTGALTTFGFNGVGTLGDGGDDIAINSNDWDITSAGLASGLSGNISMWTNDNNYLSGSSTALSAWNAIFVGRSATTTIYGDNTTSTFSGGIQATYLNLTGTSATSTLANGIKLKGGCIENANGVCLLSSASAGATVALDNLAGVAINMSLISDTDNLDDLGSAANRWRHIYNNKTSSTLLSVYESVTIGGTATTTINGNNTTSTFAGGVKASHLYTSAGLTVAGGVIFPADSLLDAYIPNNITIDLATAASALNANPTDCSANQFANTIAANGNLTCASIADADVPDTLTASNYLLLTGGTLMGLLTPQGGIATSTWDSVNIGATTKGTGAFTTLSANLFTGSLATSTLDGFNIGITTSGRAIFTHATTTNFAVTGVATSTFSSPININGNIARNGVNLTTTSTFKLYPSLTSTTGTNIQATPPTLIPYNCYAMEATISATSTPGTGQPLVVDVNMINSTRTATTSIFTATLMPQLNTGTNTASTTPASSFATPILTKGSYLNIDTDQYGGHAGVEVQIQCAKSLW